MTKGKKKQPGRKIGAREHFQGFKKNFLDTQAVSYQVSLDSRKTGEFYDKVTRDFIAKFGVEDDVTKDPAEDPPNPWDNPGDSDNELDEPLTKEEADKRSENFQKLRTVSYVQVYWIWID
jgi:hypothetical protein